MVWIFCIARILQLGNILEVAASMASSTSIVGSQSYENQEYLSHTLDRNEFLSQHTVRCHRPHRLLPKCLRFLQS